MIDCMLCSASGFYLNLFLKQHFFVVISLIHLVI